MALTIQQQMAANSAAWHTADAATKKVLEAENQKLGAQIGATYTPSTGTWANSSGGSLYGSTPTSTAGSTTKPSGSGTTTPAPKPAATQTVYYDPTGAKQTGYIINGTTYKDAAGTQRIDQGSVVQTAGGFYKLGASGGEYVGSTYTPPTVKTAATPPPATTTQPGYVPPAGAVKTTITRNGQIITGYIDQGVTVDDKGQRVIAGDIVNAANGSKYLMTEAGKGVDLGKEKAASVYGKNSELGIPDLGSMAGQVYQLGGQYYDSRTGKLAGAGFIDLGNGQYYDTETGQVMTQDQIGQIERSAQIQAQMKAAQEAQLAQIQADIEAARQQLEGTKQEGLQELDQAAAQSEITARQNMDNLALRSARMGDLGGIGQKQYSEASNANDKRLLEISLEKRNLETSTQQQIAQLQAQGKMAEAQIISELGMKQLQLLIDEEDKLNALRRDQELTNAQLFGTYRGQPTLDTQETNYNRALQRLQLGIFSEQDAAILGIPADQAKQFAQTINLMAQIDLGMAQNKLAKVANPTQTAAPKTTTTTTAAGASMGYQSTLNNVKRALAGRNTADPTVLTQVVDYLQKQVNTKPPVITEAEAEEILRQIGLY